MSTVYGPERATGGDADAAWNAVAKSCQAADEAPEQDRLWEACQEAWGGLIVTSRAAGLNPWSEAGKHQERARNGREAGQ